VATDLDKMPPSAALDRMTEIARSSLLPLAPADHDMMLAAVSARVTARGRRRALGPRLPVLGLGLAAAACAVWLLLPGTRSNVKPTEGLTYHIEKGEILKGGYLRAFGDNGMRLRFVEGTSLEFMPGARGRLHSVDARGAHFAIDQGTASVQVTHRPGAQWLVDAGPFLITVKGTAFTVAWNATSEQLDLRLVRGLVSVTGGPLSEGAIAVHAGQRLAINLPKKEVLLQEIENTDVPQSPAATMAPPPREMPAKPPAPERAESAPRLPPRASSPRDWGAALAAGDVDAILRDVEQAGLRRSLAEASSEELSILADAARYRRQEGIARQALMAQRRRFPRSIRATEAAFLLGRLEEAHRGGEEKALAWYDDYLLRAPAGEYTAEALGRKMFAMQKLERITEAQAVAREYLRRFPAGSYAGAAGALCDTP
jgi:hypothetical protein